MSGAFSNPSRSGPPLLSRNGFSAHQPAHTPPTHPSTSPEVPHQIRARSWRFRPLGVPGAAVEVLEVAGLVRALGFPTWSGPWDRPG